MYLLIHKGVPGIPLRRTFLLMSQQSPMIPLAILNSPHFLIFNIVSLPLILTYQHKMSI